MERLSMTVMERLMGGRRYLIRRSTRFADASSLIISVPTRCSPRALMRRSVEFSGIEGRIIGPCLRGTTFRTLTNCSNPSKTGSASSEAKSCSCSSSPLTNSRRFLESTPSRTRVRALEKCFVKTSGESAESIGASSKSYFSPSSANLSRSFAVISFS